VSHGHHYRVEVRGSTLVSYFDSSKVATADDVFLRREGGIGIYCGSGEIRAERFPVTSLQVLACSRGTTINS